MPRAKKGPLSPSGSRRSGMPTFDAGDRHVFIAEDDARPFAGGDARLHRLLSAQGDTTWLRRVEVFNVAEPLDESASRGAATFAHEGCTRLPRNLCENSEMVPAFHYSGK